MALAIEAVHLKQIEYFEFYMINHDEKSKYKKVKFTNCSSKYGCRSDLEKISITYGMGGGVINNRDSKRTIIYATKKGEILIYDENDRNGNTISEIIFYQEEGCLLFVLILSDLKSIT